MKQSSVEWLFEKLWEEPKDKLTWYSILKKAEEMEENKIRKAIQWGIDNGRKGGCSIYDIDNFIQSLKQPK